MLYRVIPDADVVYPDSYQRNSSKDKRILECVDNFRRQYIYIYPDRKPLFLVPLNECDIEVSVTSQQNIYIFCYYLLCV